MYSTFERDSTGMYIDAVAFEEYKENFIHKNYKKTRELQLKNFWAAKKMPDEILHFKKVGDRYKVPAGVASFFDTKEFFGEVIHESFPSLSNDLFDYQVQAVESLTKRSTGLLHASTGSGKTYMICEIIRRLGRKALVVVHNLTQLEQMVDDIEEILGITPRSISGKKGTKAQLAKEDDRITVLNIDSRDKIEDYTQFGTILLDECDMYLGSDDRREWVGSLSAEYQYGLTGTIKIQYIDDQVFELYYGKKTELKLLHLTPKYQKVLSSFTYVLDDMKDFHELKKAMYENTNRNTLIINTVLGNKAGRKGLVFCDSVEHAKFLEQEFIKLGIKTFLMIGEVSKEDRKRIRAEAKAYEGEVVIIGSVRIIGRGFDLPELSYAVLTVPEKFDSSILQYVGRIIRKHPTKPAPIFFDICDIETRILNNQSKTRQQNFLRAFPDGVISY